VVLTIKNHPSRGGFWSGSRQLIAEELQVGLQDLQPVHQQVLVALVLDQQELVALRQDLRALGSKDLVLRLEHLVVDLVAFVFPCLCLLPTLTVI
jgi:hypothetical protein